MAHQKPHDPMASVVLIGSIIVLLATLYVLVSNLFSTIEQNTTKGADDLSLQMAAADINIQPIGAVHTVDKSIAPKARTGEEVYGAICTGCHEAGALGAPKTNAKEDWTARIATGWKALMDSAINGKGQMPARGGDPSLTDDEIKNAILYMTSKAGFDLATEASAGEAPADAATDTAAADTAATTTDNTTTATAPTAPAAAPTTTESASAPVAPQAPAQMPTPAAPQAPAQTPTPAAPQAPQVANTAPSPEAPVSEPAAATTTPDATPAPEAPTAAAPAVAPTPEAAPAPTATAPVASEQGEKIYKSLCFSCHDVGIANSPKFGDKEVWQARIATGMEALYASSINGKGAMPAKGGNPSLSDEDVKAAVDYMIFHVK
ncbi:MAG: c-type cytochrome [bacterium]